MTILYRPGTFCNRLFKMMDRRTHETGLGLSKGCQPTQVGGYFAMNAAMPSMLSWVLGGNGTVIKNQERAVCCHIDDKPQAFPTEVKAAPLKVTICWIMVT